MFLSDQLVVLDEGRGWQFSELATNVVNGRADIKAFLDVPMRGEASNCQLLCVMRIRVPALHQKFILDTMHTDPESGPEQTRYAY